MRRGRGASLPAGFARWAGRWAAAWALTLLAGCGDYDPPVAADHDAAHYQADLAACQTSGDAAADRLAKATFPMFVSYPISLPFEQRVQISRCMAAKGYKDRG
jgi:hypothetical protein